MVKSEGSVAEGLPGGNLSHSGAPVSEVLAHLDEQEARTSRKRVGVWKKPPLKVYQDNFGFAVNAYQPMIDYINKKDIGEKPEKDVHLPLLEERCMREYQSNKPVHGYSNSDIDFFIDKGEKIRSNIRQNDACGVSNVINRTHTNWSMTRKWVQLVKNSTVSEYKKNRGIELEREPSVNRSILGRASQKSAEFENIPRKIPQGENFRETTPRPNYVDDSSVDFARAVKDLGAMELSDKALQERKAKLDELDARFEDSVNKMCNYVNKLTADRSPVQAMVNDQIDTQDYMRRNQARRQMELANLEDSVYELTNKDSNRNQLRRDLQTLDSQMRASHNINEIGLITDDEFKQAMYEIKQNRLKSRARSQYEYEHDDTNYLPIENLGLKVPEETKPMQVEEKKKPATPKGPVITDTYANVVARASDMACLTSEMRKISNRSRFVNCYRPQIKTGDPNAIVQPSKLEQNIDHMANTLALDGKMRRRFDVDDEIEEPKSNLNSQMKEKYAENKIHKPVVFPPSNSMKLRRADLRAQSRITLLGY